MQLIEGHIPSVCYTLDSFLYNIVRNYRRMCVVKKNC